MCERVKISNAHKRLTTTHIFCICNRQNNHLFKIQLFKIRIVNEKNYVDVVIKRLWASFTWNIIARENMSVEHVYVLDGVVITFRTHHLLCLSTRTHHRQDPHIQTPKPTSRISMRREKTDTCQNYGTYSCYIYCPNTHESTQTVIPRPF